MRVVEAPHLTFERSDTIVIVDQTTTVMDKEQRKSFRSRLLERKWNGIKFQCLGETSGTGSGNLEGKIGLRDGHLGR